MARSGFEITAVIPDPETLYTILGEIVGERMHQEAKFGDQSHRSPFEWLAILAEEFGEAARGVCETGFLPEPFGDDEATEIALAAAGRNFRQELIQTAAVAVAMLQTGDRRGWWPTTGDES